MAMNESYFSAVAYAGTAGGNTVWYYFDYNADNVASIGGAEVNAVYFSRLYTNLGIVARQGDLILAASRSATYGGDNTATPCMLIVPTTWDSNGASVIGLRLP